jgi:ATP-dependent DNA helicase PIF1
MHCNAIDCEVLTRTERNKRILIPRTNLTYSGTILLFNFQRSQFPIIAAFAMTINKSQKQTFAAYIFVHSCHTWSQSF